MKRFFVLISIFTALAIHAQDVIEKRVEFTYEEGFGSFRTLVTQNKKLVTIGNKDESKRNNLQYRAWRYNNDLLLTDSVDFTIEGKYHSSQNFKNGGKEYFLYHNLQSGSTTISRLDIENMEHQQVLSHLPKKFHIKSAVNYRETAHMIIAKKNTFSYVTMNLNSGKTDLKPVNSNLKKIQISGLQADSVTGSVYLFYSSGKKLKKVYYLNLYKGNNTPETVEFHSASEELWLSDFSGTDLGGGHHIFTGTYRNKYAGNAQGMFVAKFANGKRVFFKTYDFTQDFTDFFKYLSEKRQAKIEKKKKRKSKKGKDLKNTFYVASHPVITTENGFLYIGEIYFPTYRTEYRTVYVNGRPTTQAVQVFDGYQYSHATVIAFDENGNKKWDRIMDMVVWYKPFVPLRFIRPSMEDQILNLVYASGNSIYSKRFNLAGQVLKDDKRSVVKTEDENDKIKRGNSYLIHWYEDTYVSFGFMLIKNKEAEDRKDRKRKVYYINKFQLGKTDD